MMKALQAASAASLTSALDFGTSWNKWYYGLDYRVREGADDADSTKVIFSNTVLDTDGLFSQQTTYINFLCFQNVVLTIKLGDSTI